MSGHGEGKAVKYLKIQLKFQNVWHLSHFPKLSGGPDMSFWLTTSGPQALCLPTPGIKFLFCFFLRLSFLQPFMSPRYPGGPRPSLRMPNQPPGSIPGSQPLLPNSLDPTRPQGTDGHCAVLQRNFILASKWESSFFLLYGFVIDPSGAAMPTLCVLSQDIQTWVVQWEWIPPEAWEAWAHR